MTYYEWPKIAFYVGRTRRFRFSSLIMSCLSPHERPKIQMLSCRNMYDPDDVTYNWNYF